MQIKFQTHYVTNGQVKVRCRYTSGKDIHGRSRVVLYSKDYGHALSALFLDEYENNTDTQTDYFERGNVTLYSDHPLYAAALQRAEKNDAAFDKRWMALQQKRKERYLARRGLQAAVGA